MELELTLTAIIVVLGIVGGLWYLTDKSIELIFGIGKLFKWLFFDWRVEEPCRHASGNFIQRHDGWVMCEDCKGFVSRRD